MTYKELIQSFNGVGMSVTCSSIESDIRIMINGFYEDARTVTVPSSLRGLHNEFMREVDEYTALATSMRTPITHPSGSSDSKRLDKLNSNLMSLYKEIMAKL